ncbi:MAG: alpha/beta fold hydrolase [Rhodospirillales bacterium]|nr:alpha/beta fold hydrolase [Rhodospirillales bacterium]
MRETVQIPAGHSQYIRATYVRPDERAMDGANRELIIMVHGFPGNKNGTSDVFTDFEDVIGHKNYHTLRFDFRGCGASDGQPEDFTLHSAAQDFQTILQWAKDKHYQRFVFVGEGLGASIALMNGPPEALCYILLWPMIDLPMIARHVFRCDEIESDLTQNGFIQFEDEHVGFPFLQQLKTANMAKVLKDLGKPLLIMHGAKDERSPIEQLDMFRASAGKRRVEITSFQDGTHGLPQVNHRKSMFFHMRQFIEKYS